MKKTATLSPLFLLCFALLTGCGGEEMILGAGSPSNACNSEMRKVTRSYGDPEEINEYEYIDETFVHYYWYYSEGIGFRFYWGESVDGCETTTYTFSPS